MFNLSFDNAHMKKPTFAYGGFSLRALVFTHLCLTLLHSERPFCTQKGLSECNRIKNLLDVIGEIFFERGKYR